MAVIGNIVELCKIILDGSQVVVGMDQELCSSLQVLIHHHFAP